MRFFFATLAVAGLLAVSSLGARPAVAASPPQWVTFTPVCTVRWITPDGEFHAQKDVGSVEVRFQWDKGVWDQIRLPGDQRTIPVTLVQISPCP